MTNDLKLPKENAAKNFQDAIKSYNTQLEVSFIWNRFVNEIKYSNRFFPPPSFQKYLDMLLDFKEILKPKINLYRARKIKSDDLQNINFSKCDFPPKRSGIDGFRKDKIGPPPIDKTSDGRANPAGIPYLYLASNPQTACSELRPTALDLFSVSRFSLINNLKIINLNLVNLNKRKDLKYDEERAFISCVMNSFAMPINEQNSVEYAPSQYIAAFLMTQNIGGIKYISYNDQKISSYNLVIFNSENAKCLDEVGDVYSCSKKIVEFQNISDVSGKSKNIIRASTLSSIRKLEEIYLFRNKLEKYIQKNTKTR